MQYSVICDTARMSEWGLTAQEGLLYGYLCYLPRWADRIEEEGKDYWYISKSKICREVPCISTVPHSIYKILKRLENKGLIVVYPGSKSIKKTYVHLTPEKTVQWCSSGSGEALLPLGRSHSSHTGGTTSPIREKDHVIRDQVTRDQKQEDRISFDQGSGFEEAWGQYPRKEGRKEAWRHYKADVKTEEDHARMLVSLGNYKKLVELDNASRNGDARPWQHGKTWFNNWRDYEKIDTVLAGESKWDRISRENRENREAKARGETI